MEERIKEIIIIGGGPSISEGIELGLKEKIQNKCSLGTNYCYRHFDLTALCFTDRDFYRPLHMKSNKEGNPDIYDELGKLPCLIIGERKNPDLDKIAHKNTILIQSPNKHMRPSSILSGIFALAIADALEPETIFLLGYDFSRRPHGTFPTGSRYRPRTDAIETHYYKKEIPHAGLGFVGFYENHNPENYFKFFKGSKSKIFNVCPTSNIQTFEKIDYSTMFSKLDNTIYNQIELRQQIRTKLV